jgi:hypothetical protein
MSDRQVMPVQIEVIKEVLVDRLLGEVLTRYPGDPLPAVVDALTAEIDLPVADGGPLDLRMRRIGYLSRIVEAEMFDPARNPMDGLAGEVAERLEADGDWSAAVTAISFTRAREEPLPKPSPNDPKATSWQVPGPGGHVRHFVVAAAIAECLNEGDRELPDGVEDAAELKRCWMYGFLVRCCEEALPPPKDVQ